MSAKLCTTFGHEATLGSNITIAYECIAIALSPCHYIRAATSSSWVQRQIGFLTRKQSKISRNYIKINCPV